MSLKAPVKSRRSLKRQRVRQLRPQLPLSSRRGVQRIWRLRSKRSPHLPKPFSVAMANRRQQTRKKDDLPRNKDDLPLAADPPIPAETDLAGEGLLIFRLAGESFGLMLSAVAEIIRLPNLAYMPLVP